MDPLAITASGVALVVMSGRLDISVGSTAFLSCAIGALLINQSDLNPGLSRAHRRLLRRAARRDQRIHRGRAERQRSRRDVEHDDCLQGVALALTDALLVHCRRQSGSLAIPGLGRSLDLLVMLVVLVSCICCKRERPSVVRSWR